MHASQMGAKTTFALHAGVFAKTFRRLHERGVRPEVLYPAVTLPPLGTLAQAKERWRSTLPDSVVSLLPENAVIFLSINRFERKKVRS